MEQLKERIEEVAKYKEVSIRQMESACQLKRGNLSNISKCGTIGLDKASKILDAFPDISPDWLISGKGSMLRENYLKSTQNRILVGQGVNGDIHSNGIGDVNVSNVSLGASNMYDRDPLTNQMERRKVESTPNRKQENQAEILIERNRTLEAENRRFKVAAELKGIYHKMVTGSCRLAYQQTACTGKSQILRYRHHLYPSDS